MQSEWPASFCRLAPVAIVWCVSISRSMEFVSVEPASRTLASKNAHVAGPAANRYPRPARSPDLRQLLHHRSRQPGDLHRMRATPLGQPPHRARAALPDLPRITGADLFPLRRDHALRNLPHDRATLVPDLPTPLSEMLELHPTRSDRCRHPDPPALRRLRAAPVLARLPHLQRPRPPETRAMRAVSDQQAPRRDHGPGHGRPRSWAAGPAPRHRYRRTFHHRQPLAHQTTRRIGTGGPGSRAHAPDPRHSTSCPNDRSSSTCVSRWSLSALSPNATRNLSASSERSPTSLPHNRIRPVGKSCTAT